MTLQEIKDQVAQEHACCTWEDLPHFTRQYLVDDIVKLYAKAYAEADRKDCAEKAKVSKLESYEMDKSNVKPTGTYYLREGAAYFIDKSSILDRPYPEMK